MSNVSITIGGRAFTIACADGEEAHITSLGEMIDERLSAMGDQAGNSESRVLLFAALILADELHEAKRQSQAANPVLQISAPLLAIAERLENLADSLENRSAAA